MRSEILSLKTLVVQADLSEMDKIRQFLKESLRELDITEKDYFTLELALVEMCVNVIRYAYPEVRGEISLVVRRGRGNISIEIRDSGVAFDPRSVPRPDIDEIVQAGRKGGLGIYLARKLMDEFRYRREDAQNVLTLVKKIP